MYPRSIPPKKNLGTESSLGKYVRKISQEILVGEWRSVTRKERKLTNGCINERVSIADNWDAVPLSTSGRVWRAHASEWLRWKDEEAGILILQLYSSLAEICFWRHQSLGTSGLLMLQHRDSIGSKVGSARKIMLLARIAVVTVEEIWKGEWQHLYNNFESSVADCLGHWGLTS